MTLALCTGSENEILVTGHFLYKKDPLLDTVDGDLGKKPWWISEEIRLLKKLWPNAPRAEIEQAIINRTWFSIRAKASRMGIKREILDRNDDGTFKRLRRLWSLENFDDGFVDNNGRFRVWMPDHPKAYEGGYILRARVAFEAYYKLQIPSDMDIHHIDGNRLNDSKENLAMFPHELHSKRSNRKRVLSARVRRMCEHCGKDFIIKKGRLNDKSSGRRGRFCSQKCYHAHMRSEIHKQKISDGLKRAYKEGRRD